MKKRLFILCLSAALLLPALVLTFQPADEPSDPAPRPARSVASVRGVSPAKSPGTAAEARAEAVRQFVQIIGLWEHASGSEGDRLEEQLRDLITDENAEAILRAVPPSFHGTYVANLLLARWAAKDRHAAIQWLAGQNHPTLFEVNAVTKNWVVEELDGLETYLDALPASPWKSLVLESTGRDALTNRDPELAFSLLQDLEDSPARGPLLANAVQQWAQWDPRTAVEEINLLPDPDVRERLVLAAASGYAMVNPDAAADWLRESFPDGATLDGGLAGVMQAWASAGDPASGARWVTELPAGPTRDHALKELVAAWNQESPEALKNWISTLPEGATRAQADAALDSLAPLP